MYSLFPDALPPYAAVQSNRECWGRAHEALERRGRNGVAGDVMEIFRDESIEREVEDGARSRKKSRENGNNVATAENNNVTGES